MYTRELPSRKLELEPYLVFQKWELQSCSEVAGSNQLTVVTSTRLKFSLSLLVTSSITYTTYTTSPKQTEMVYRETYTLEIDPTSIRAYLLLAVIAINEYSGSNFYLVYFLIELNRDEY